MRGSALEGDVVTGRVLHAVGLVHVGCTGIEGAGAAEDQGEPFGIVGMDREFFGVGGDVEHEHEDARVFNGTTLPAFELGGAIFDKVLAPLSLDMMM